jgi:uncharacterized protein (TIGR01777 family)
MQILVTGSSGLIGSSLLNFLTSKGHQVTRLVRSRPSSGEAGIYWDPLAGLIDAASIEGFDAVVHLAGENIAGGRWTAERKAGIRDSRIKGTRLLSDSLARLAKRPAVFASASATGYYGDRGDEMLRETSSSGSGFLPQVCREWETSTEAAVRRGIRVVNLRIGVVLSSRGGALKKMLPPFRLGLGGKIGSGRQYMSWIAIDDLVRVIGHTLENVALAGPVNVVSPNPATNAEFTETLGRVLSRPTLFPMPGFAARLVFGQMADELLLASARVEPARLIEKGFVFRFARLEPALRHVLGKA